jgi:hypothetical protein
MQDRRLATYWVRLGGTNGRSCRGVVMVGWRDKKYPSSRLLVAVPVDQRAAIAPPSNAQETAT